MTNPPLDVDALYDRNVPQDKRMADLLRRRADVYNPAREHNPYYGDADIDLLRACVAALEAEVARLTVSLQAEKLNRRDAEQDTERIRSRNQDLLAELASLRAPATEDDREGLAALEHEQWIAWSKDIAATEPINEERRTRWASLWRKYEDLSESEKDQDREWADKVLVVICRLVAAARAQGERAGIEKATQAAFAVANEELPPDDQRPEHARRALWASACGRIMERIRAKTAPEPQEDHNG